MLLNELPKTLENFARRLRALEVREVKGAGGGGGGTGDMTKAVYDTDNDGSVETADYAAVAGDADTVDGSHAAAFALAGHVHAGMGDMTKAVYDTDNDNTVEAADYAATAGDADTVDGSHAAAFALSGHTHAQLHDAVTLAASADTLLGLSGQALALDVQNANKVFAGPTTGADAVPTFRALVIGDIPAGVGGHTIQDEGSDMTSRPILNFIGGSVAVADDPGNTRTNVTVTPVTLAVDADTLLGLTGQQLTLDSQNANLVLAGPSSGAAADPAFRSLVVADLPAATLKRAYTFYIPGDVTVSSGVMRLPNHFGATLTILGVYLDITTAPTGQDLIVDIHKAATTIFTNQANRPVIADGAVAGNTTTIDVPTWADGDYLLAHVDQIGTTAAGADLTITVVATF